MENMELWDKLKSPPAEALKKIEGGRLVGKTDINPQWRYKAMTQLFGVCGFGWKYTIDKKWTEEGSTGQIFCFVDVSLYVMQNGRWSEAIPGTGGSQLIEKDKNGLKQNDDGYKMATTDALSVAMKMLGVAADIYEGNMDGSKYSRPVGQAQKKTPIKTQKKADKTPPERNLKAEDHKMLREMFGSDNKKYKEGLKKITLYKDGDDKEWFIQSVKNVDYNSKNGKITHGKIKTAYTKWKEGRKDLISEEQVKLFYVVAKNANWDEKAYMGLIGEVYQIERPEDIPIKFFDEIIKTMKDMPIEGNSLEKS